MIIFLGPGQFFDPGMDDSNFLKYSKIINNIYELNLYYNNRSDSYR